MKRRPNLLPLPPDVELHSWMWVILRLRWSKTFPESR